MFPWKASSFLWVFSGQQRPLQHLDPLLLVAQIVAGVSAISSSLCRIIRRSTVYLGREELKWRAKKQQSPSCDPPPPPGSQWGQMCQPFASLTGPLLNHFITCVHYHNGMKGLKRLTPNYYNYFIIIRKSDKEWEGEITWTVIRFPSLSA